MLERMHNLLGNCSSRSYISSPWPVDLLVRTCGRPMLAVDIGYAKHCHDVFV